MILTDENGKKWEVDEENMREAKPKKVVDLAHLAESGIDCEVSDYDWDKYGGGVYKLQSFTIRKDGLTCAAVHGVDCSWRHCRPRMNHWHYWDSDKAPVPEGFRLEVYERDEGKYATNSDNPDLDWLEIVGFKVLGLSEGYCYPWEVET